MADDEVARPENSDRGFRWATDQVVRVGDRMRMSVALLAGLFVSPRVAQSEMIEVKEVMTGEDGVKDVVFGRTSDTDRVLADNERLEVPFVVALGKHGLSPENRILINGHDMTGRIRGIRISSDINSATLVSIDFVPGRVVVVGAVDERAITPPPAGLPQNRGGSWLE